MTPPKVVYDTMVLLQAAANPHRRYATLEAAEDRRVQLCVSSDLLTELRGVLSRPSMAAKLPSLTRERVSHFLQHIQLIATTYDPVLPLFTLSRHSDDDHVFNLAIAAQADFLVTWEKRLLNLASSTDPESQLLWQFVPRLIILSPAELGARLPPSEPGERGSI